MTQPADLQLPDLEDASAAEVVAWAAQTFGANVALACSFQKEESVLLEYLFQADPNARAFALDTDLLFPETYELLGTVEERYSTTIERWRGPSLQEQAAEHGEELWTRDPSLWLRDPQDRPAEGRPLGPRCLDHRESAASSRPPARTPRRWSGTSSSALVKVNPLADWTDKDVWREVHKLGLPYPPAPRSGLRLDRLRAVHAPGRGPRGPLGRHRQGRVRPAPGSRVVACSASIRSSSPSAWSSASSSASRASAAAR